MGSPFRDPFRGHKEALKERREVPLRDLLRVPLKALEGSFTVERLVAGALIIRIGFGNTLYHNYNKEHPQNSIGNYSGPSIILLTQAQMRSLCPHDSCRFGVAGGCGLCEAVRFGACWVSGAGFIGLVGVPGLAYRVYNSIGA